MPMISSKPLQPERLPSGKSAATGSGKVLVQQPAPKVSIEQAPAEVTVSQGQPRGNQLVISGLTNEQIGTLAEWKSGDANFKPLADDQITKMKTSS